MLFVIAVHRLSDLSQVVAAGVDVGPLDEEHDRGLQRPERNHRATDEPEDDPSQRHPRAPDAPSSLADVTNPETSQHDGRNPGKEEEDERQYTENQARGCPAARDRAEALERGTIVLGQRLGAGNHELPVALGTCGAPARVLVARLEPSPALA